MATGMIAQLRQVESDLRRGTSAAGLAGFAKFIDALMVALPAMPGGGNRLLPVLQRGLEAQQRADYLGLADVLAYELSPLLEEAD